MKEYREGLNFVPMLDESFSPPTSSRSLLSIGGKRSQRSFLSYNGNYEGDISMFKEKSFELELLNLEDSESDENNLQKEVAAISTRSRLMVQSKISLMWRLFQFIIISFFQPEMQEKIFQRLQQIMDSFWYKYMLKCLMSLCYLGMLIVQFTMKLINYVAFLGNFMWKRRLIFRNILRSILRWLTLANCNDLTFFALILICSPVQFILALIGFIIAISGFLMNLIQNLTYAIKFKFN